MAKTNTPQIKIVNCTTGEEIVRDANADEIAQMKLDADNAVSRKTAEAEQATAKAELLAKLGITADEAKLLLG